MPSSLHDRDCSIIEFYHEEPELQIMEKVVEINHPTVYEARALLPGPKLPVPNNKPLLESNPNQLLNLNSPSTPQKTYQDEDPDIIFVGEFIRSNKTALNNFHETIDLTGSQFIAQSIPNQHHSLTASTPFYLQPNIDSVQYLPSHSESFTDQAPLQFHTELNMTYNECIELQKRNLVSRNLSNDIKLCDSEIVQIERLLEALKSTEKELLERCDKNTSENADRPFKLPLVQNIYFENKAKTRQNLSFSNKQQCGFLYHQLEDTEVYHKNQESHMGFKDKLIDYLKKDKENAARQKSIVTKQYDSLMEIWKKKTEEVLQSKQWRAKQDKYYEYFSKEFPNMPKIFSTRKRDVVEAKDWEEMMAKERVVPPTIVKQKHTFLVNRDPYLIEDPVAEHEQINKIFLARWSVEEKRTFIQAFRQKARKKFTLEFAEEFNNKSVKDCVKFYYLNKHVGELREVISAYSKKRKVTSKTKEGKKMLSGKNKRNLLQ